MIALTGTPGTGKSSVADALKKRGYKVKSVVELAKEYECILDWDDDVIVDIDKLASFNFEGIVEGHLSHLLNPETVIVLRCNPLIIKERLIERGYEEEKVMENVEAELVDVILIEAVERCEDVYEIDTSEMSISEVADIVEQILKGEEVKNRYRPGKVDWLSKLEDRLDEVARW